MKNKRDNYNQGSLENIEVVERYGKKKITAYMRKGPNKQFPQERGE